MDRDHGAPASGAQLTHVRWPGDGGEVLMSRVDQKTRFFFARSLQVVVHRVGEAVHG